ncbi:MAG: endonuclease MutS2 [Clostridia bacterium]|nr:endonuclease MutS2 [Clostridia bacterium]
MTTKKQKTAFYHAAKTLEYDKILALWASLTSLEGAKEEILATLPETNITEAQKKLNETAVARVLLEKKGQPSFFGVRAVADSVDRADKGAVLTPAELLNIGRLTACTKSLKAYSENDAGILEERFALLQPTPHLDAEIKNVFLSEDAIADTASPELATIRRRIRSAGARVRETLQKYITSPSYTKFLQENIVTQRSGRWVLAVKAECKNEIKGLIHDTSASGSTVFIEPSGVVDLNNEIRVLENEEAREIEKILAALSALVAGQKDALLLNYSLIISLAVIFARAELAVHLKATQPKISERDEISIVRGRHPLIDKDKVVPVSINVGRDWDTLVITGPNTGGKTVCLKTVGLFVMMAQTGLHIPAEDGSTLRFFETVLADIGDEQSIEQSLSTFSSHMVNIVKMLSHLSDKSLILFDELGAGTDPVEGAALAEAILEHCRRGGAITVATTHYAELKTYALETERVQNAACEFDVSTLRPTYKLIIGSPGRSNAFLISEKLGISPEIIASAQANVHSENKRFEEVIERLEEQRLQAEKAHAEAEAIKRELEEKLSTAERDRERLLSSAENELEKARVEANRMITAARSSCEYVFAELDKLKKEKDKEAFRENYEKTRSELRASLKEGEKRSDSKMEIDEGEAELPRALVVGDKVLITGIGKEGTVEKINGNTVTVRAGNMSMKVKDTTLRILTGLKSGDDKKKQKKSATWSARPQVKAEIDLRGMTGDDAWFMVDKYLDDAQSAGLLSVTLIHGKGTGALRAAMWRYLKGDRRVASYRAGAYGEGDFGVTVVELK